MTVKHYTLTLCAALTLAACTSTTETTLPLISPVDAKDMGANTPDLSTPDHGAQDLGPDLQTSADMETDLGALTDMSAADQGADMRVDPDEPSLSVTVDGDQITITWQLQAATHLRLLRRAGAAVVDAQDPEATLLTEGTPASFNHPTSDLEPAPTSYHYALFDCDAQGQSCALAAPPEQLTLTLTQALRGGGYNIIWRHASASTCGDSTALGDAANTAQPDWWRSCESDCNVATARQLTEPNASAELMQVNAYMSGNQVPFSRVLSSEFCRCFQTADGFNLGPATEQLTALTFFVYDEANRCADTYALLNTAPAAATNVAMVGHAGFSCATLDALAWGEAAIFKPQPAQAEPKLIQRVRAEQWSQLP